MRHRIGRSSHKQIGQRSISTRRHKQIGQRSISTRRPGTPPRHAAQALRKEDVHLKVFIQDRV